MRFLRAMLRRPTEPAKGERRDPRKFYRFALYGRTVSGKTCFMARMAMGAMGHPEGLDCTRLPVTLPLPSGPPESWGAEEIEAAELHAGWKWIDQAIAALRCAELPKGNPAADKVQKTVDYEVSDPHRGATLVRMIDYSGELIDPGREHDPESLANELKARLRGLDGLIVMADASSSGPRAGDLADDHRLLREALTSLADSPGFERTAVVAVFTKWDRESEIRVDDPRAEFQRLETFLAANPSHKALVDSIRNLAAPGGGSTRVVFPASAFGRAVQEGGWDLPARERNRPFGLLEPLLSLADIRDSIEAERIESEAASWNPRRLLKLRKRARDVLPRMPAAAESTARIRTARARSLPRLAAMALGTLAILASLSASIAGWTLNRRAFEALQWVALNPGAGEAHLADARERLQRYNDGGWLRWLPLAPRSEEVESVRHRIDERLDQVYWSAVEMTGSLADRAEAARTYIDHRPQGTHRDAAKQIYGDFKQHLADQAIDAELNACEEAIQRAAGDKPQLLALVGELGSKAVADNPRRDRIAALLARCREQIAAKDWASILGLLASDDLKGSAEAWTRFATDEGAWTQHSEELLDRFQRIGERKLQDFLQQERLKEADRHLDTVEQALAVVEGAGRRLAPSLGDRVLEVKRAMGPGGMQRRRIGVARDRTMYEAFLKAPSIELAREYLDTVPEGTMREPVAGYVAAVNARSTPKSIVIQAFLVWDRAYTDTEDDHVFLLTVGGANFLKIKNLTPIPGDTSGEIGRFVMQNARLNLSYQFKADLLEEDVFSSHDEVGSGVDTFKLSALEGEGKRIPLRPPNGEPFLNHVLLKIVSGAPPQQEFPPWKAP